MMKRALLPLLLTFPLFHIGGCSSEDAPVVVPGVAGTGSPGTSGSASGGSSPGASGSGTGVSGSGTEGGSSTGTSGSTSGGSTSGGSGTGGGATGGTGSGGMSGSGTTGGGGAGGAGGTTTGGTGMGGAAGGTAAAVSVGKLDGMLIMTPCGDAPDGDDCLGGGIIYEGKTIACQGGTLDSDVEKERFDFPITGGEKGKHYMANVHFYGMMEPKNYGNAVTRQAGTQRPNETQNPSKPDPLATAPGGTMVARTTYNNYEVHSYDDTGKEIAQYYVNSDTREGHYMFAVSYDAKIEIVSGGKVHIRVLDTNCRMIKNCLGGPPCSDQKARRIDLTGADPQPVGLMQPGMGKPAQHSGQWFFIDVKDIVAK